MNPIERVFGAKVLLPVVHPAGWDEALAAVRVATDAGVRGIFLINQGMGTEEVIRLIAEVRRGFPRLWIGANFLGHTLVEAFELAGEARVDGVWTDNARIDERAGEQPEAARALEARRRWSGEGLYFGGVAFKYQRAVPDEQLGEAARAAAAYMDVICTSGPGTGHAAAVAKVAAMRAGAGPGTAIALASGVTVENVASYLPYVDAFLVGTGIEHSFGVLDPARVVALRRAIEG